MQCGGDSVPHMREGQCRCACSGEHRIEVFYGGDQAAHLQNR
jgi:hypothetical protein